MRLVFVRHCDPDYSIDSLTPKGWREAELVANRLEKLDVKAFYRSPLGRARDTANVTLNRIGREAKVYDWLQEFYVPVDDPDIPGKRRIPWDFMPAYWTNIPELYAHDKWLDAPVMGTVDVAARCREACTGIDEILASHGYRRDGRFYRTDRGNTDTLVFFCHLGIEFILLSHLLGISPPLLWQGFFVAPGSITVLVTEERVKGEAFFRCKALDDTAHYYIADEQPSDAGFFCETYKEF
jgi:probable phosphoglycerate mutase